MKSLHLSILKYHGVLKYTMEYSYLCVFVCVCLSVCPSVCLSVYTITQKIIWSFHLKLEHIVVYENSSNEFDTEHCPIKVKVSPFTTIQLSSAVSQFWHMLGSCDVC